MQPLVICISVLLTSGLASGQTRTGTIPQIVEKNGRHTLMVDGQPFFMLGGQAHNSSAWPGMMPQVWSCSKNNECEYSRSSDLLGAN